jgi:glycosyltransferase involved in cell wall biosynthesis
VQLNHGPTKDWVARVTRSSPQNFTVHDSLPSLVSEIVLCYNQARFVVETLESVRAQNYRHTELIIVDDCSTDDSVATIEHWLNRTAVTCTFIRHVQNSGICKSLNDALAVAKGKYISLIAADDTWLPDKIDVQVEQMEAAPETVGVLYSDALQMDEEGKSLPEMFISAHRRLAEMPQGDVLEILLEDNFIPAMTTLIRRSCFEQVGRYDETLAYEDWDMWLRIAQKYQFVYSPVVSAKYRIVKASMMRSRAEELKKSRDRIILKHLEVGRLSKERIEYAARLLSQGGRAAYETNTKGSRRLLRKAFILQPSKRRLVIFVFAALGLPFSVFARCRALWRIVQRQDDCHGEGSRGN